MGVIEKHEQMLYPVVRVRTKRAGGSGTVIYSKPDAEGKIHTYVMTNHHVISSCIQVKKQWDEFFKKDIKKEVKSTCQVEYFNYNKISHATSTMSVEGDVVAYSAHEGGQDWALIKLRDEENQAKYVADMIPKDKIDTLKIFDEVYAVGAALGHPPLGTKGEIMFLDDEIDRYKYGLSTAASVFGNSGGAIFRYSQKRKRYEFIGIPSRISVSFMGFSASPITHMGYFIVPERIYGLLKDNYYQFIYDDSFTIEKCEKIRKSAMKREMHKRKKEIEESVDEESFDDEDNDDAFGLD